MKRTLYFLANLYKGGSLVLHDTIFDAIVRRPESVVITFRTDPVKQLPGYDCPSARVEVVTYPWARCNGINRLYLEHVYVARVARRTKCERVIMFGNFPCLGWGGEQRVYFHNYNYLVDPHRSLHVSLALQSLFFRWSARIRPSQFYCQLHETALQLRNRGLQAVGLRVPFCGQIAEHTRLAGDGALRLFYPAFAYPAKNHILLARAYAHFRAMNCTVLLTVPPHVFRELFRGKEDVFENCGEVSYERVQKIYDEVNAVIFPSVSESLGYPLIEGLTKGLPVLAADLPYAKAVLGEYGVYFDPADASSIGNALQTLRASGVDDAARARCIARTLCSPIEFVDYINE